MRAVVDAYDVCRTVRRYTQKNGYAPTRSELGCTEEDVELLAKNGVLELLPLYEGGPLVKARLTSKGLRMAELPVKRPR